MFAFKTKFSVYVWKLNFHSCLVSEFKKKTLKRKHKANCITNRIFIVSEVYKCIYSFWFPLFLSLKNILYFVLRFCEKVVFSLFYVVFTNNSNSFKIPHQQDKKMYHQQRVLLLFFSPILSTLSTSSWELKKKQLANIKQHINWCSWGFPKRTLFWHETEVNV